MRGTQEHQDNKDRWVAWQITLARLAGYPVTVVTKDRSLRYNPDGTVEKISNES